MRPGSVPTTARKHADRDSRPYLSASASGTGEALDEGTDDFADESLEDWANTGDGEHSSELDGEKI